MVRILLYLTRRVADNCWIQTWMRRTGAPPRTRPVRLLDTVLAWCILAATALPPSEEGTPPASPGLVFRVLLLVVVASVLIVSVTATDSQSVQEYSDDVRICPLEKLLGLSERIAPCLLCVRHQQDTRGLSCQHTGIGKTHYRRSVEEHHIRLTL